MNILGRIQFPKSAEISDLYIRCHEGTSINNQDFSQGVSFVKGGMISSNTYFNSFYEQFYGKYTNLASIYYLLRLEGDFQVSVYRESYGKDEREPISIHNFDRCQLTNNIKIALPKLRENETAGRIYLEIMCLSEQGFFQEGLIATEQEKIQEITLGIITCTFKKETYIKNTVNTILADKLLEAKNLKIFVVDNGKTLKEDDFNDPRVQLIANRNVGGSGGFTRGLLAALQSNSFTHFLFMDDDIDLESESIYRLFSLYEYRKEDFAVSGTMLDLHKKHILYEAGALYGRKADRKSSGPFSVTSVKHNLDLKDSASLNAILWEEPIDYGAFWFFAFSQEVLTQIGLPMPFFIRIDDIEFGLRITEKLGNKIVAFPAIAVWHEPFYLKFPIWDNYYAHRNSLITDTMRGSLRYIDAVKQIAEGLILSLCVFDYNSAQMVLKGFEDYLKGPNFIKKTDPEKLHSDMLKLSKTYHNQNIQPMDSPPTKYDRESESGTLKKLLSLLTVNGHLLPNFLTTNDEVFIWHGLGYSGQRTKAFRKKRVLLFKEGTGCVFENEIDKALGIKLLAQWLNLAAIASIKWRSISKEWQNAARDLTSTLFWQEYLQLNK
jgi:galactofuranosylgalactofuranosylrhamnosyl-N-acetylglucosaminyl-diphospho-decaprenol beta-1,5/1,6-galactofuranosyltransferase